MASTDIPVAGRGSRCETVGVLADVWRATAVAEAPTRRTVADLYREAVRYKANPRPKDYMAALLGEQHPGATVADVDRDANWPEQVARAGQVVLLYPDAIGMGFSGIERKLVRAMRPGAALLVLNGRRRDFPLSVRMHRGLRFRRFLAWTMLPEFVAMTAFILITPFLLAWDWLRGRR